MSAQFSSDDQRTLASLAATCRAMYFHVVPKLYRVYRIALAGAASFEHRTDVVRRLLSTATRVAGRGLPLDCIREIVVCGRWHHPVKPDVPYAGPRVARAREYAPFVDALSELLARVARLQSFRWLIDLQLPDAVAAAAAGHASLESLSLALETPLRSAASCSRASSPNVSLPLPFTDNRLVALRAHQIPTLASAVHCSHVLWTESNRQTIRTLELGVSQTLLDDWFYRCADVVAALFTPPPLSGLGADWRKGQLPRLKLHRLKLCDVAFLRAAVDAVVRSVDAGELRDLQLLYCSNPSALFRRWEDNALPNLERLFVLEQHESGYSARLLRQFGPDGTCRNLRALEATCWMPQWADDDGVGGRDGASAGDDGADSNGDERFVQFCSQRFILHDREAPWEPGVRSLAPPPPLPGQTRLEPFATIRELCGNREEGWGLERLVLSGSWSAGHLPDQHNFLEPFWRLRELACHVSYTERWVGVLFRDDGDC